MAQLILLRHGESMWNKKNLFTGWVDVPLSPKGIEEALAAGEQIKDMPIDIIFTSTLIRGIMTGMLVMSKHASGKTPVLTHENGHLKDWANIYSEKAKAETIPVIMADALNERMYGELQGKNKEETRQEFGADQVKLWRRSYSVRPPNGESLELTAQRSIPYFIETIVPHLKAGKNVLVPAHGNSLRSIMKFLDNLTDDEVVNLELATGVPVVYTYENNTFIKSK